jgi:hypothetical protein
MYDREMFVSFVLIIFVSICIFIIGVITGSVKTTKEYQQQAISNNFAHWEVNLDGKTTFMWNVQTNNVKE